MAEQASQQKIKEVSWKDFKKDTLSMAKQIEAFVAERPNVVLVAVTRDGLFPTGIIAHKLGLHRIDTITLLHKSQVLFQRPDAPNKEAIESLLFVDSICDSGRTVQTLKGFYPSAQFAATYVREGQEELLDIYGKKITHSDWIKFPWDN